MSNLRAPSDSTARSAVAAHGSPPRDPGSGGLSPLSAPPAVSEPDLQALLQAWTAYLKTEKFSDSTLEHYPLFFKRWWHWIEARGLTLADAAHDDVQAFLAEIRKTCSPAAVKMYLVSVRSFYKWARRRGGGEVRDPTEGIPLPKIPKNIHKRDRLTDAEVRAVLATCDDTPAGRRARAIVSLMFYGTMRRIEIHRADLGDLEERAGRQILWIWGKKREGKDDIKVLPAPAEDALRAWLAVRPGPLTGSLFTTLLEPCGKLSKNSISAIVRRHLRQAGIHDPRKTPHSLRHAGADNAFEHGANLLQVQQMLGHRDISTTMVYLHGKDRLKNPAEDHIILNEDTGAEENASDEKAIAPADR
jgi:site-specific recombinase XerD